MDGLSPTSCRYIVHYKEAVRERQRMRLFMTYWELEETNWLRTLLMSLYAETNVEFHRAEQDAQALLTALVTKQSLTRVADDAQYLDAVRQRNKTSLQETDAQLNLLKDRSMQRLPVKLSAEDSDSLSNCIGDSPSATDEYTSQLLAGDSEIYPSNHDSSGNAYTDSVLLQPWLSHPGYYGNQHDGQAQASGSNSHQTHLLPPANISIDRDVNFYDPSTNPYAAVAVMPMPWHIPSYPQVQFPPHFLDYDQQPANHQLYRNMNPPESHRGSSALQVLEVSQRNNESPSFGFLGYPPEICDDVAEVDPTPTAHSHIVSVQPCYPSSNMSSFLPEFKHPMLSIDSDVLLPPDAEDESSREPGVDAILPSDCGVKRSARPDLLFDDTNKTHQWIVNSAKREITKYALNIATVTEEGERVTLAENKLEEAAKRIMGEKHGITWSSHNSGSLYMTLSGPCKDIMQICRKHMSSLVVDGFDLRLSIWSEASESAHQKIIIADLLDNRIFPPKFLMELGTDNEWHFLENKVVRNVILNTVHELKLCWYLEELDSIACTAAVAVFGTLDKMGNNRVSADLESSSTIFKEMFTKLINYIKVTINNSPRLQRQWEMYKQCIKARLAQYL
ncbi:hypothetical protein EV702DRAFT_1199856 [Suillus placidus]|uniref:Uncharacterized protein n=1 Tax=Suillus placidus TaxID=48579 RepID=A0A9P7D0Y5_9AGAM|nr:hypothetical protein EV702DRAFT_1199856 [Suillus placidus]